MATDEWIEELQAVPFISKVSLLFRFLNHIL